MNNDWKWSEWKEDPAGRYRELYSGTIECGDFYCEQCGDCLACYSNWSEDHECWAIQFEDEFMEEQ